MNRLRGFLLSLYGLKLVKVCSFVLFHQRYSPTKYFVLHSKYSDIRRNYEQWEMKREEMELSPALQFQNWLEDAIAAEDTEPTAMSLATVDASGQPTQRVVLLKDVSDAGISFFTNYNSSKGVQMGHNPKVSANFFWPLLERQVRWEGRVSKLSAEASDNYFASRPRESRIGAWASPQSRVIGGDDMLMERFRKFEQQFRGEEVPRPPHWGGYLIVPHKVEFWQGRPNRMHQRFVYTLQPDGEWDLMQVAP